VDGNGTIYIADTGNYRVQKLAPSGAPIAEWHSFGGLRTGRRSSAAPLKVAVDAAGQIYVADDFNNAVWKLAADGEILGRWSASGEQLPASFNPSAVAVDSAQSVHVSDGLQIQTFSPAGEPVARWEPRGACLGKLNNSRGITFDGEGHAYLADTGNGRILKLSSSGDVLAFWALRSGPERIGPAAVAADRVGNIYVAAGDRIQKLAPSGAVLAEWGSGTEPGQFNSPGGLAIDQAGSLYVADTGNNRIQKLPAAAMGSSTTGMSQPAPAPRCFSEGTVTEYRQGRSYHPAIGPDGSLWYSTFGGEIELKRLAADGTVTQVTSGDTWFLTAGPGGALWYTGTSRVARFGADGRITDFALPTKNTQTRGITAGPDGAMWYVGSDRIGRIAPDGAITEYPVRTPTVKLWSITPGPDGALWFIDQRAELVGRITTGGTITEYSIPPADRAQSSGPIDTSYSGATIATGPDGALWFTRPLDGQIGRISTQGALTTYQVPWTGACPLGIAAGADGALWFTDRCGEQIGRITTAGTIENFRLSTSPNSAPWYIAAGSDGALWVTASDLVARIAITTNQPAGARATTVGTAGTAPAPAPRPAIVGPAGRPPQRPLSPPSASPMETLPLQPWR
jgi:virginiamycin B lyase